MSRAAVPAPPVDPALAAQFAHARRLVAESPGRSLAPAALAGALEFARTAFGAGRSDWALEVLEVLARRAPEDALVWRQLGFAHRDEQQMAESLDAFSRARALQPDDAVCALALAETAAACGLPAAALFAAAQSLAPQDLRVVRGRALALAAEGAADAAEELLEDALARHPGWLEGHQSLSTLRSTRGDAHLFARSYADACVLQPDNAALRMAWFGAVALTRDWTAALAIIEAGERISGPTTGFALARLFVASESGDHAVAERLFARMADLRDPVKEIAYVRHCLRTGQPESAEAVALRLVATPAAASIWPYLSLIWRMRGDQRAAWLDGEPPFVRTIDLTWSPAERQELIELLRGLHTARAPHLDQSVRGGTQTDGQLFFRPEPILQRTKLMVQAAVREYVASLPAAAPGHPLLGTPRGGRPLFSGSWSVRLGGSGYHVSHTHPKGWISSALYVSLPPAGQLGSPPSGWIRFGTAPQELGLELPPYQDVEPVAGRLALFPSTMWHRTLPFERGERLVIAFDVRVPRAD